MSEQPMDLRRSVHIVRRHKIFIGAVAAVGLLVGGAYSFVRPPMLSSTALIQLRQLSPSTPQSATTTGPSAGMATQMVIASSDPVLEGALAHISPALSLQELRSDVHVTSSTPNIMSISVKGTTAAQAEARTNAVATSYVAYVGTSRSGFRKLDASVLNQASSATGNTLTHRLLYALLGAVIGALLGIIAIVTIRRRDRRLFRRDDLAHSIGIPVLASVPVSRPADAAGWRRLLEAYRPGDLYGWRLRHALQQLGMADVNPHTGRYAGNSSLAVVSLSSDLKAVALGPQLAAYAASLAIPTALVIGSQEDSAVTATLRTACALPLPQSAERSNYLQIVSSDFGDIRQLNAVLTVVVATVDGSAPQLRGSARTTATVIGVSAGAATAEQLARVAMSAAADGREIAGILVADPEPTDATTGRIPQPPRRPQHRVLTVQKDPVTETTRVNRP